MRYDIAAGLRPLCDGIAALSRLAPNPAITVEGHLVRSLGEVIAALEYDLFLLPFREGVYSATAPDGSNVQICAAFRDTLSIVFDPGLYLALKLNWDGTYEELYNGPVEWLQTALPPSNVPRLTGVSSSTLRHLATTSPPAPRIPKRPLPPVP